MTSPNQPTWRGDASAAARAAALLGATTAFAKTPEALHRDAKRSNSAKYLGSAGASNGQAKTKIDTPLLRSPGRGSITSNVQSRPQLQPRGGSTIAATQAAVQISPALRPENAVPASYGGQIAGRAVVEAAAKLQPVQDLPLRKHRPEDAPLLPSTSALVKLFEQTGRSQIGTTASTPLQSPRPIRKTLILDTHTSPPASPSPETRLEQRDADEVALGKAAEGLGIQLNTMRLRQDLESFRSAKAELSPVRSRKAISPRPLQAPRPTISSRTQSERPRANTHENSIPILIAPKVSPRGRPQSPMRSASTQSITAAFHQMHPRRMTPLRTGDALANAIVASSLASSRVPSPTKLPPSGGLRAQKSGHSLFARTPSPAKKPSTAILRQTLRKDTGSSESTDDDEDPYSKHKKKRHIRKHPNKHNEANRKRWRDAITERERKRYEGVWAANRGLHVVFSAEEQDMLAYQYANAKVSSELRENVAEQVSSVVVKDIWSRSRLPDHVLSDVWELVDRQRVGRLSREEFVIGLWLIDQRLKGRKLPMKVSNSVWESVTFLQGIRLRMK